MRQEILNFPKEHIFEACLSILDKHNDYTIFYKNISLGLIEAKKSLSLLSFGHDLKVEIKAIDKQTSQLNITSTTIGLQIFDWGTNSDNEYEIITTVLNTLQ